MWEQKDKDYKDYGDYVEEGIEETRMNEKKENGNEERPPRSKTQL